MTNAQLIYATIATIGLALGWRECFGWFRWRLAPIIAGAALWATPAVAQDTLTDTVTHVRDGDTIVIGRHTPAGVEIVVVANLMTFESRATTATVTRSP